MRNDDKYLHFRDKILDIATKVSADYEDHVFGEWIEPLKAYGWSVSECGETQIGRQIRLRNPNVMTELRITQNMATEAIEAEHVMCPDPDAYGRDMSFTAFTAHQLKDLLRHISYTRRP